MPPLNNTRHELFAQGIASGKDNKTSMLDAGYTEGTAKTNGWAIRNRDDVSKRIHELVTLKTSESLVTSQKLHERWSDMFNADIADIMADDGSFLPIKQWPKVWRQMLQGMDVKELFERSKDGGNSSWDKIGNLVKIKWVATKDLGELLGKHKAVDAFVREKTGDTHLHLHAQIVERLAAGRKRLEDNQQVIDVTPEPST